MNKCINGNNRFCENLIIKVAKEKEHIGNYFFGCKLYPECKKLINTGFNELKISTEEQRIINVFGCFVNLNSFLMATYGTVYFNLRNSGLLDYSLKTDIIKDYKEPVEYGRTGARIFYALYYHLYLIPDELIKLYLRNNFPGSYSKYKNGNKPIVFSESVDYDNNRVIEKDFIEYKDWYMNY